MVERLINYSQAKNYTRSCHRQHSPISRYESPTHACERGSRTSRQSEYEPEVIRRHKADDYPTRERRPCDTEIYRKQTFCKNNDVRYVRDLSKRLKETIKSMSSYPVTQVDLPEVTEASEKSGQPGTETCFSAPVNSRQIQAAAEMVSQRIETVPVPVPDTRTIAVPLTPSSSEAIPLFPEPKDLISKSVQTLEIVINRRSVQTTTSTIELPVERVKIPTRKSKSFSEFSDKNLKDEILEWLEDTRDPKVKKLQESVIKKIGDKVKKITGFSSEGKCYKCNKSSKIMKQHVANELQKIHLYCCSACNSSEVLKLESDTQRVTLDQNEFEEIVKDWINKINIKKRDFLQRPVKKDQIYNTIVHRLKRFIIKRPEVHRDQSLRAEILDILDEMPIECQAGSKSAHLKVLADALAGKLDKVLLQEKKREMKRDRNEVFGDCNVFVAQNVQPSERELKNLVADAMIELINKTNTIIKPDCIEDIEMDLTDILMDSISSLRERETNSAKDDVANLLHSVIKLPVNEAIDFATQLTGHLKEKVNSKFDNIIKNQQQTVLMLHNTSKKNINIRHPSVTEPSSTDNNDQEPDCYFGNYIKQLSKEIDEWLNNLHIPHAHDKDFRQGVVNDLASDIIDRHKYLELNNSRSSDTDELEHLKYQIFKWINKLVGEDIMKTIDHAADLMQRIRKHLDPIFGGFHEQINKYSNDVYRINAMNEEATSKRMSTMKVANDTDNICRRKDTHIQKPSSNTQTVLTLKTNQSLSKDLGRASLNSNQPGPSADLKSPSTTERPACQSSKPLASSLRPPCCTGPHPPGAPSMKQLNDEFNDFLMAWVQEIPIPANTPEEHALAEKARTGIHHGIWKTIIKIKFHPEMFHNRFYYEDVLEEELDQLLDCLPQTKELQEVRYQLKIKLIQKTTDISEMIKTVSSPATYKQQLAQQISGNLPRTKVRPEDDDPNKQYEEMLVQCIAEDFILSTRYKEEDKVKAIAYKNKVIKRIEAFLDEVKRTHGKEIEDLDKDLCVNDIFSALHKVPLPSEDTIKEEADEILLGIEIEQWFTDLPVVQNPDQIEQLHRKRLKDALTKKLHEMEKELNVADCYAEPEFKHEISLFLDKVPLEKNEDLNINFMVDELTNRMKNRERAGGKRRSVAFQNNNQQDKGTNQSRRQSQGRFDAAHGEQYSLTLPSTDNSNQSVAPATHGAYQKFSSERAACSSMINAPPEPEQQVSAPDFIRYEAPQKWYSWDSKGNPKDSSMNVQPPEPQFVYTPGRFQEEHLGGNFGQTLHGGQRPCERYPSPAPIDSPNLYRQGPSLPRFLDTEANVIHYPTPPGAQNQQPIGQQPMNSQMHQMSAGPQNIGSPKGTMYNQAGIPQYQAPQNMQPAPRDGTNMYEHFNEPVEFVSLLYDSKPPPPSPQYSSAQGPVNQQPQFEQYGQTPKQTLPPGGRYSNQPPVPDQIPLAHISQRAPSPSRVNEIHASRQQLSMREEAERSQLAHQSRREPSIISQGRMQASRQNASATNARSIREGSPPRGLHKSIREQMASEEAMVPATEDKMQKFCPSTCQPGNREGLNSSMPFPFAHRPGPHNDEGLNRSAPPGTLPPSQDQRFLSINPPPSGISISNQPGGFSTPNQRTSNAMPPNIKVRRQIDREKNSRRVESDSDGDDGEERMRCQCIERIRKCRRNRPGRAICDCEDCLGAFPYYFPMGCPYPYMFNNRRHCP